MAQFAAVSRNRVYGVDDLGSLVVLDAKTGSMIGRMPGDGTTRALVNDQTDRLYLVSNDGMVQCLREIGAKEPFYHQPRGRGTGNAGRRQAQPEPVPLELPKIRRRKRRVPADTDDPFGGAADEEPIDGADGEPKQTTGRRDADRSERRRRISASR